MTEDTRSGQLSGMHSPHWPLFDLRIKTERLELRPPTDNELIDLANLAARGVHDPKTMPFAVPWTDELPGALERKFLQYHWAQRGALCPANWNIELAVWADGRLVGAQGIRAESFATKSLQDRPRHVAFPTRSRNGDVGRARALLAAPRRIPRVNMRAPEFAGFSSRLPEVLAELRDHD